MKHRLIILFLALTTSLAALGGLAALLTTGPHSPGADPALSLEPDRSEMAPLIIARRPTGGSWGG